MISPCVFDAERGPGWKWSSDGSGSYEMEPVANLLRGTRIELKLKDAGKTFADKKVIEGTLLSLKGPSCGWE